MAEINGYLLTKEEEKACVDLVKKMRKETGFTIDFSGYVRIKAKDQEEAKNIFWEWLGDLQDKTLTDWDRVVGLPYFEYDGIEEE